VPQSKLGFAKLQKERSPPRASLPTRSRSSWPSPRYASADEIAGMVAYLAGPEAGFVTGASLTIDGGFNA